MQHLIARFQPALIVHAGDLQSLVSTAGYSEEEAISDTSLNSLAVNDR